MRAQRVGLATWAVLLLVAARSALGAVEEARRPPEYLAPFVPTPMKVVEAMLKLARVTPKDVVYDLGCGDGRIVITAAKRFGARGVGIDIDYRRVGEAIENVKRQGVENKVRIILGDALEADLSEATVVTLYLLTEANLKLRPRLLAQLRPGARVVSHDFGMGSLKPDKVVEVTDESGWTHTLYLWVIKPPAPASGKWVWEDKRGRHTVKLRQEGSAISGVYIGPDGKGKPLVDAFVWGKRVHFAVRTDRGRRVFDGTVEGDTIEGRILIEPEGRSATWRARRLPVRAAGRWRLRVSLPWGEVKGTLALRGRSRLSGALEVGGRKFPVEGRLFGATAAVEAKFATPAGEAVLRLEGLVDGDRMDGPFRIEPFKVEGWFEATREGD